MLEVNVKSKKCSVKELSIGSFFRMGTELYMVAGQESSERRFAVQLSGKNGGRGSMFNISDEEVEPVEGEESWFAGSLEEGEMFICNGSLGIRTDNVPANFPNIGSKWITAIPVGHKTYFNDKESGKVFSQVWVLSRDTYVEKITKVEVM